MEYNYLQSVLGPKGNGYFNIFTEKSNIYIMIFPSNTFVSFVFLRIEGQSTWSQIYRPQLT